MEELVREMNDNINEVSGILRIRSGTCRILLNKFNWNKESLLERYFLVEDMFYCCFRYYENPDTDRFLRDLQVIPKKASLPPQNTVGDCVVCCSKEMISGLQCNHWCCSTCWEQYLTMKVSFFVFFCLKYVFISRLCKIAQRIYNALPSTAHYLLKMKRFYSKF